ncbi:MAG: regulatory protein RecX [Dehalococcoidia bacterium]|nr:regulatory protein RecX [Dehalococcoidia bacterium]
MALVRSIERRRGGVAAITVDDDAPIEIPLETVLEHGLHEGSSLLTEEWVAIRDQSRYRLAVRRALEFLSRRRRTRSELQKQLLKAFSEAETNGALARIDQLGYVDDESWAKDYVTTIRARGRGRSLLARELSQRGIDDEAQESALAEHDDRGEALAIARKRLRSLQRLAPEVRDRRLYAFLRRRGFSNDTAKQAMDEALRADDVTSDLAGRSDGMEALVESELS